MNNSIGVKIFMKQARIKDHWEHIYKRKFSNYFSTIDLNGLNGIKQVEMNSGLIAICGLNGAGKSTIISAVKDVIGLPMSEMDSYKMEAASIQATFIYDESKIECSNIETNRLSDNGIDTEQFKFLDWKASTAFQDYFISQSNLEELLDQFEPHEYEPKDIEDINFLTQKRYDFCSVTEIEDVESFDVIPYFCVKFGSTEYDSRSMGIGEHFLFYLFWCLKKSKRGTILIIEEPETYVSIISQQNFIDLLAKYIDNNNLSVILTTHSPYILNRIKNENIRLVSRVGNMVAINTPGSNVDAELILGLQNHYLGTFFVEDRVASDFLSILLEDKAPFYLKTFTIEIAEGGHSAITNRLTFPCSDKIKYKFIGVYDGDAREEIKPSKIQWKYCFLPGKKALEECFRDYILKEDNLKKFCDIIQKDEGELLTILSPIQGADCHDWFEELRKSLATDGKMLVRSFYEAMKDSDLNIEAFLEELQKCME